MTPAPSLGPNGGPVEFDVLKDMVAALREQNAPFSRPGWVFAPRTINRLEKLKDSTGRYLSEAGLLTFDPTGAGGTLLGYPFKTTTQIPTNLTVGESTNCTEIYFSSDWDELWLGEEDELRIAVSPEASYWTGSDWVSSFQARQHLFRSTWTHDVGLRRPSLFSVMTGIH